MKLEPQSVYWNLVGSSQPGPPTAFTSCFRGIQSRTCSSGKSWNVQYLTYGVTQDQLVAWPLPSRIMLPRYKNTWKGGCKSPSSVCCSINRDEKGLFNGAKLVSNNIFAYMWLRDIEGHGAVVLWTKLRSSALYFNTVFFRVGKSFLYFLCSHID